MQQVTYVQKNLDRIKFVSEPESLYPAADWKNLLLHVVVFQNDKFYMGSNVHANLPTYLNVEPAEFEKFGAMSAHSAYFFLLKRFNFLKAIRPDMVFTPKESIINSQSGNDEVTSIIISTSNPSDGDLYIDVDGMVEMKEVPVYLRMKCLRKVSDLLRKRVIAKSFEEDIEFLDFNEEVDRKKQEILHFTSSEGQLDVSRICDVNHKQLISSI